MVPPYHGAYKNKSAPKGAYASNTNLVNSVYATSSGFGIFGPEQLAIGRMSIPAKSHMTFRISSPP